MDMQKVDVFVNLEWQPKSYDSLDLSMMFDLPLVESENVVKMINGGYSFDRILHHDLQEYLQDLKSISRVPTQGCQVSKGAHWLVIVGGWGFNPKYAKYRYVDPQEPECRYTLRGALRIQHERHPSQDDLSNYSVGLLGPQEPKLLMGPALA
jgi:hypothetical protein